MRRELTADEVRSLLDYDEETGVFRWRMNRSGKIKAGQIAGSVKRDGYVRIGIHGATYSANRLAWLHVHGSISAGEVDHINGHRADNRIKNLRLVSRSVNKQNLRGVSGASMRPNGTWRATIRVDGKCRHLGNFRDEDAARAAYLAAKRRLHPGCTI